MFSLDYSVRRREFRQWINSTGVKSSKRSYLKGKNFLAAEVWGTWDFPNGSVELSDVVIFQTAYIGATWNTSAKDREAKIYSSFAELETALGITELDD